MPDVLDVGARMVRTRMNQTITNVLNSAFLNAQDGIEDADALSSLDQPPPTSLEHVDDSSVYMMNVVLTNDHAVAKELEVLPEIPTSLTRDVPEVETDILDQVEKATPESFKTNEDIRKVIKRKPHKFKKLMKNMATVFLRNGEKLINRGLGFSIEILRWFIDNVFSAVCIFTNSRLLTYLFCLSFGAK